MTTQRFVRRNHGNGHSYQLDGQSIPGVTTVNGILSKPGLTNWAGNMAGQAVLDDWDRIVAMTPSERQAFVAKSHDRYRDKAANRGKRIHTLAEKVAAGEHVEPPAEIYAQVDAVARMLDSWELHPIASESPVCNTQYRYAGTFDAVMESPKLGTILVDYKTREDAKAPYNEVGLQLAAYRNCDVRLVEVPQQGPRGGKKPSLWVEKPMLEVDDCYVISVAGDSATLWPVVTDQSVWTVFLYLLEIHETWIKRTDWKFKDDPAWSPLIGDPMWPEDQAAIA